MRSNTNKTGARACQIWRSFAGKTLPAGRNLMTAMYIHVPRSGSQEKTVVINMQTRLNYADCFVVYGSSVRVVECFCSLSCCLPSGT